MKEQDITLAIIEMPAVFHESEDGHQYRVINSLESSLGQTLATIKSIASASCPNLTAAKLKNIGMETIHFEQEKIVRYRFRFFGKIKEKISDKDLKKMNMAIKALIKGCSFIKECNSKLVTCHTSVEENQIKPIIIEGNRVSFKSRKLESTCKKLLSTIAKSPVGTSLKAGSSNASPTNITQKFKQDINGKNLRFPTHKELESIVEVKGAFLGWQVDDDRTIYLDNKGKYKISNHCTNFQKLSEAGYGSDVSFTLRLKGQVYLIEELKIESTKKQLLESLTLNLNV